MRLDSGMRVACVKAALADMRGMTGSERTRASYPQNAVEDATWDNRLRRIYRGLPGNPHIAGGEEGLVRSEKRLRGEMDAWVGGYYPSETAYLMDDDYMNAHRGMRHPTREQRQQFRDQVLRTRSRTLPGEMRTEVQAQPTPLTRLRNVWGQLRGTLGLKASPYGRAYAGYDGSPRVRLPRQPRLRASLGMPRPAADPFGAYGARRATSLPRIPRIPGVPRVRGY